MAVRTLKRQHVRGLVYLLSASLLLACSGEGGLESLGKPTPIRSGQTPLDVICAIQAEFYALPKPVLDRVEHRPADTRSMAVEFHRTTEHLPEYYHFQLTAPARAWVQTHTSAELSVALMPLVQDPDLGGEAAVVLTSLASGRTFRIGSYGYHNSKIAAKVSKFMHDVGYRSPSQRGRWDSESALQFRVPEQVALAFEVPPDAAQAPVTLNQQLDALQSDVLYYENGLMASLIYGRDAFVTVDKLDDWLAANGLPEHPRPEKHRALLERWEAPLLVLGAYPRGVPAGIGVYVMGFEKYWPLLYGYPRTVTEAYRHQSLPKLDEYRREYRRAVKERVYQLARKECAVAAAAPAVGPNPT